MWTLSKNNHLFVWIFLIFKFVNSADVVIDIPQNGEEDETSSYRVFYTPPYGNPKPNVTFLAKGVHSISLSNALPGTKYEFKLYYSNTTRQDWPIYTASITTAPDPPSNISVTLINGTSVNVTFQPPKRGSWDSFKLKMQLRNAENKPTKEVLLKDYKPYVVKDLTPGGTYLFQLFTEYDKKESIIPTDYIFTTRPNTPTKCIVWFRNETTLKFLWQPPLSPPVSIFSHYKVKIVPGDSSKSELIIENGDDPPGPAQAIFRDLVPGRPYNMSVQAVSDNEVASLPIFAQYRTTPLQPANLQVDPASVTTNSFTITWDPPEETTEFDKYLISINVQQTSLILPLVRNKTEMRSLTFNERLLPGRTYRVSAMTVSGKVNSAEATTNVTLRPLPVKHLKAVLGENGHVRLTWKPDNSSTQQSFEISYTEVYNNSILNGDTNILVSTKPEFILESLLPGRNYSIGVKAVSHKSQSSPVITFQATKPSAPVIEELKPIEFGLNISWKSDVNSRQEKYEILHVRNGSDSKPVRNMTKETHILLDNLYPGAGYNIKVFAISHDLKSEPHDYFQAVYPKPPTNLRKYNVTSNSLSLAWDEPKDSLFSEFAIRSRTEDNPKWTKYSVSKTGVEIKPLMPGQHYLFQINSVSFGVDSASSVTFNHTVYPSPVSNIATLIDSTNVTIEFPRPEGRIEYYVIKWVAIEKDIVLTDEQKSKNISDDNSRAGTLVRILIDNLIPGVKYQFSIQTFSYNLTSSSTTFIALTVPLILSELVVVSSVQKPREMTIRYTPTPLNSSHFDKYQFNLSDVSYIQERDVKDPERKVTFVDLVPGKLYNITVWTVSNNVHSQPLYRQDRLYPEPVTRVFATDITDTHVTLVWDKPQGEYDSYEVQYLNSEGVLMQNLTTDENCTIDNLKPYKNYTFTITVISGSVSNILRRSSAQSMVFQTKEGLPGIVRDFHPINIYPREVNFEWTLPESQWNGILKRFIILYNQEGFSDVVLTEFSPNDSNGSIKGLLPGKVYLFRIKAETTVGFGPESVWQGEMPILAPPKPSSQMVPSEVYRTSSTIQIRFRKNYFSDENGPIVAYTLIVAEDDLKNTSGIEMPSWSDVQGYEIWPPYQVLDPYYPFKNTVAEDYTIGTENCENKEGGYCNGPLKAGTTYRVKIRAFTAPSKFMDTEYSFPIQTDRSVLNILLYSLLPCVILITIGTAFYFLRKFNIIKKNAPDDENMNLSDCRMETSKPVKLDRFAAYYETMSADSDFRFSEEFEKLKHVGKELTTNAANLPCNRPKNRFTNILPYDHSRYKLQPADDEEGSDYINANYVPGFNSPREFIVTQGPLPSTKDDFWRMCWESHSTSIVMLTKCFEKGREKCDHYWPEDTNRVCYGDISVTILNECVYSNWCTTEMVVQRGDIQRVVRHFHFTSWPDFGVPNPPTILVKFVNAFRNKIGQESRPIIVHCSAGVGRSGTFIAIDRILQSLEHKVDTVDIFGIVYQMRRERVLMVQTEQQYICIHQCVLAVLQGCESQPVYRVDAHHNLGYEDDEGIAESGI